jgi:hypothetical protein
MKTGLYTVQLDPVSHEDDAGAVFLREGFSWGAALFTVLWAAWRGLWVWAMALLVVELALMGVHAWIGFDPVSWAVLLIGYHLLVGFSANDWRRARLTRRGHLDAGVVLGRNLVAAEQRFFDLRGALAR